MTLDGCVDHEAVEPNADMHAHAAEWIERNDVLLFGRVTYQMMEEAWRLDADGNPPDWMDDWMQPFSHTIDATPKYVVSTTLESVDWNAELLDYSDLAASVRALKDQPGEGIATGGVAFPNALADLGLIDEYQFVVHPVVAGHGPYLFGGISRPLDLELIDSDDLGAGVTALRYSPAH